MSRAEGVWGRVFRAKEGCKGGIRDRFFWHAEMLGFYSECGGFILREICILPNNILGSIIQENHPGNTNEVESGGWEISNDLYEKG